MSPRKRKVSKDAERWLDTSKPVDLEGHIPLREIESELEERKRKQKFLTPDQVEELYLRVINEKKGEGDGTEKSTG